MRWIEALQSIPEMGVKKGQRFRYPYQAAQALAARSKVMWVDGPHKVKPPEPEDAPAPEPGIEEDQGISAEDLLGGGDEPEEEGDLLSLDGFLSLDKKDQKDLIREHGLEDECDMRSSESMAEAYGLLTN